MQVEPPQVTGPEHDCAPVQLIVQLDAAEQSTACVHELLPQSTWHGTPGGQVTDVQIVVVQSILHVPLTSQVPPAAPQTSAHAAASTGTESIAPSPEASLVFPSPVAVGGL